MKINLSKYIIGLFPLLLLVACSSDDFCINEEVRNEYAYIEGDKVVVNLSVDAPAIHDAGTRALSGTPDYNDMHLYLVEFDDNGSPLINTLKTVYTPEEETPQTDRVLYKVVLNKSDQPRILHLIALPKSEELNVEYGVEGTVIPSLKTSEGTPAFWRRLTFEHGYCHVENGKEILSTELDQLKHVALIRNFACISITNTENSNFELKGFAVINDPTAGTMAPWKSQNYSFPEFLKSGTDQPQDYTDLSAVYNGISPASLTFNNQDAGPVVEDNTDPKYVYERPFNSLRHTYIIIKGRRKSVNAGAGDSEDSYYKLDLGKTDSQGVFRYFNILRNYRYNIVLKSVGTKGYADALKAAQGVVYNNFSFDIETTSMLNISDGSEVVYVNFTTKVLTDPNEQTFDFKYRYRSLSSSSPTYNNDNVTFIGLEDGDVIKSVVKASKDDADGWRNVTITTYGAQTETKTQSFTIVKSSGLGRTINFILHRKWTLNNVKEFAGTLENWSDATTGGGVAGPDAGDDLTIFFDLPDNLSDTMFPMTFTLEADRQNIENNPLGMLTVTYGTSGFPNIQGNRIKYQKTVTWQQYNDPLTNNQDDNGTAINNPDGTVTHRVRCRFRTITALDNFTFDDSETTVLITNDNFNNATVTFKRHQ